MDKGDEVSVISHDPNNFAAAQAETPQATNGAGILDQGDHFLIPYLCFNGAFNWGFVAADDPCPIIGTALLQYYCLLVGVSRKKIKDIQISPTMISL